MSEVILQASKLDKTFTEGRLSVSVLQQLNFEVTAGSSVAIIGKSGSGKSTLLHLLGGLDQPSSGQVLINGEDIHQLSESERCRLRNQYLGFIYQFHHLLPEFSAVENVSIPLILNKTNKNEAQEQSVAMLEQVGLGNRLQHRLAELSGGERQRVAIARALINKPACLLADEPTGNLDTSTAHDVLDLLLSLQKNSNTSLVVVTHDMQLAKRMDAILELQEGQLQPMTVD